MIIGERLRAIREKKKLTYQQVEELTGISRSALCRIENGHVVASLDEVERIARGLDIAVCELFYDSTQPVSLENLKSRLSADDIVEFSSTGSFFGWLRSHLLKYRKVRP